MRESRTGSKADYIVITGSDFELRHTIVDDLDVAVDLTNSSLKAVVKLNETDTSAVATFTVTVTDDEGGKVTMVLPETETIKLIPGNRYYYDLHVRLSDSHALYPDFDDYPIWGTLEVKAGVTPDAV